MDKIDKALKKLSLEERQKIKNVISLIKNGVFPGMDIKKLKNHEEIFRIRKGKIRIIYRIEPSGRITILTLGRRTDNTYNLN